MKQQRTYKVEEDHSELVLDQEEYSLLLTWRRYQDGTYNDCETMIRLLELMQQGKS